MGFLSLILFVYLFCFLLVFLVLVFYCVCMCSICWEFCSVCVGRGVSMHSWIYLFIFVSLSQLLSYTSICLYILSFIYSSILPSIRPSICLCMSTLYLSQLFYVAFVSTIHQVHSSYYASNAVARRRCCLSST